jgi:hypothetical protein
MRATGIEPAPGLTGLAFQALAQQTNISPSGIHRN